MGIEFDSGSASKGPERQNEQTLDLFNKYGRNIHESPPEVKTKLAKEHGIHTTTEPRKPENFSESHERMKTARELGQLRENVYPVYTDTLEDGTHIVTVHNYDEYVNRVVGNAVDQLVAKDDLEETGTVLPPSKHTHQHWKDVENETFHPDVEARLQQVNNAYNALEIEANYRDHPDMKPQRAPRDGALGTDSAAVRTAQWNIGGGRVRTSVSNPEQEQSYSIDGVNDITRSLQLQSSDIITLQETHAKGSIAQAEIIAKRLGLPYFFNDVYDLSHIEQGQGLGQAVISKFPIKKHSFDFFYNPHYEIDRPDGSKWVSHNKGLSSCVIHLPDGTDINLLTLHLIPFRKFGIDVSKEGAKKVRDDIETKIINKTGKGRFLLQGDFNFDNSSLKPFLPGIFQDDTQEILVENGITPKGRKYDHIIYRGLKLIETKTDNTALTDHYPVFNIFET